jgi:hypothetical protein
MLNVRGEINIEVVWNVTPVGDMYVTPFRRYLLPPSTQFLISWATTSSFDQNLSATTEPVRRDLRGFLRTFTISQGKILLGELLEKDVTHCFYSAHFSVSDNVIKPDRHRKSWTVVTFPNLLLPLMVTATFIRVSVASRNYSVLRNTFLGYSALILLRVRNCNR